MAAGRLLQRRKVLDKLSATLNQLSLLQPHFVSVWDQQAHNLSYNVSAEFDDYRQRYLWVKKGIDHLVRGTQFNRRQPLMQYTLGKYTTQKFGRSDEKKQFRELFRNDDAFHRRLVEYGLDLEQPESRGSDRKPDNWLVGRLWFLKAYQLVESGAPCKKSQLHLYQEAPLALMYYSEAIEAEGVLDDRSIFAWSRAHDAWKVYGEMDILTTWNHTIQLRGQDSALKAATEAKAAFDQFTAEVQDAIIAQNIEKMTDDERRCLAKPAAERSPAESRLAASARGRFLPIPSVLAQSMPREKRAKATELANDLKDKTDFADHIGRYRELANYGYWETLSELEQTRTAVAARRQVYDAENFLRQGDLENAIANFEAGWKNWDKVLRKYPLVLHDEFCDRLLKSIDRYAKAATEGSLPEEFPLNWFYRYRALRDKNRLGDETLRLYDQFMDESKVFDAKLDMPFEVVQAGKESAATEPDSKLTNTPQDDKAASSDSKSKAPSSASIEKSPTIAPSARPPRLEPPY